MPGSHASLPPSLSPSLAFPLSLMPAWDCGSGVGVGAGAGLDIVNIANTPKHAIHADNADHPKHGDPSHNQMSNDGDCAFPVLANTAAGEVVGEGRGLRPGCVAAGPADATLLPGSTFPRPLLPPSTRFLPTPRPLSLIRTHSPAPRCRDPAIRPTPDPSNCSNARPLISYNYS